MIERIRQENEILKGELSLDQRQSRMLDSEASLMEFGKAERESAAVAKRVNELKDKASVRLHA